MLEIAGLCGYLGILLLLISFFVLIYAILSSLVSDETLFDRTRLPTTDPRRLDFYIEPAPQNDFAEPGFEPEDLTKVPYPSVFDEPTLYVSFVIPAYNEEKRLPQMLDETMAYLRKRHEMDPVNFTYELIIVDDGSKDNTANFAIQYALEHSQPNQEIRLLRNPVNMGKGASIVNGSSHARGRLILMVDADGATKIDEFGELEKRVLSYYPTDDSFDSNKNKEILAVGSRAHIEEASKAQRTIIRKILGLGFHILTVLSGVKGVQDTQCGFKLYTREAARWMFPNQHILRWCFDPEMLVIARRKNMIILEVPVEWNEIEGSKMKVSAMIKMGIDLLQIAAFYRTGLWTIKWKGDIQKDYR